PRSRVQWVEGSAHEHTGTAGALRHSLRNGLTAYAALSLETNSFCLHHCRLDGSIDPVGSNSPPAAWHQPRVSGPHGFAVRIERRHPAHRLPLMRFNSPCGSCAPTLLASTTSRLAFRDDRDAPLLSRRDSAERATDLGRMESRVFSRRRLDDPNQFESAREIRFFANTCINCLSTRLRHWTD